MMIEEVRKREERYLSFRRQETEKNRKHELLIAQIFANASQPQFPYRSQPGHQRRNSSTSSTSDLYQPVQDDIEILPLILSDSMIFQSLEPLLVFTLINIQVVKTAVMFMKG